MPPGKTRRLATASSRFAGAQWLPPAGAPANASAIDIHSAPTGLVGAENLVYDPDQQSCSLCLPAVVIAGHLPAIRLSPDHACGLLAAAVSAR
jgi:hypothetical protein